MQNGNGVPKQSPIFVQNESIEDRGIGWFIFEKLKLFQDDTLRIDARSGEKRSRGDILQKSITVALNMKKLGLTRNDIISVCTNNNSDCILPVIAAYFLGVRIAPMDPLLSIEESAHILKQIEPKFVFCCPDGSRLVKTAMKYSGINTDIVIFGNTEDYTPFAEFLAIIEGEDTFEPITVKDVHETACILFTSGTTGLPKGICLSHYALQYGLYVPIIPITILNFRPMYGIVTMFILLCCVAGRASMVSADFDPKKFFKIVHEHKVNLAIIPPDLTHKITQHVEYNKYDMSSLKIMYIVGAVIGLEQVLNLRKIFPHTCIFLSYGLTETCSVGLMFDVQNDLRLAMSKPISCGKPAKGVECKVLDLETNEELGPNEQGELWMKTETIMNGYFNDPESTDELFDNDGYMKTGDVVYYDEDGCYYIVDRIKDMMKFESFKVMPAELEQIIFQYPEVQDVIVISRPHEVDGDHPTAIIVRKPDSTCSAQDIIDFVASKVSAHKRLRGGVLFVNAIPLTPTGKYRRRELKKMLLDGTL